MITNVKLALKVLKSMDEDFIHIEASLLSIENQEARETLFKQIRDKREAVAKLLTYYQQLLLRNS